MIAIAVVYTPESFINSSILTLLARLYLFSVAFSNLPYLLIQTDQKGALFAPFCIGTSIETVVSIERLIARTSRSTRNRGAARCRRRSRAACR